MIRRPAAALTGLVLVVVATGAASVNQPPPVSAHGVTPINLATNTAGKTINVGDPWAVVIPPNGKTAYVSSFNAGTVVPINTAANKAGKPIRIGHHPAFLAVTPNGKTVYVSTDFSAYPISTATNRAGTPVKVRRPSCLVIRPWRIGNIQGPASCPQ